MLDMPFSIDELALVEEYTELWGTMDISEGCLLILYLCGGPYAEKTSLRLLCHVDASVSMK